LVKKIKYKKFFYVLAGIGLVIGLWHLTFLYQPAGTSLLPSPQATFEQIADLFYYQPRWKIWKLFSLEVFIDIGQTIGRMLVGYVFAILLGVTIGLILGRVKAFRLMFGGVIDFFRSIPVTALFPAFVLLVGVGSVSKVYMVFWACFFVICINTIYGVVQANPTRQRMAHLFGADNYDIFTKVIFFDALPQTFVGLRIALSYALIVSVLTEMVMGSKYGIGQKINDTYNNYQMDKMFAYLLITGLLGLALNKLFVYLEKKSSGWRQYDN
jgi:ABC-type nitrate/sulfonate/bicarbonate transport system permease component